MNPDLNALSGFVTVANQWERAGTDPRNLLEETLPLLQRVASSIRALRLYLLEGDTLALAATVGRDPEDTESQPTIPERRAIYSADAGCWQAAVRCQGHILGLIEAAADDDRDNCAPVLEFIALLWGSALQRQATAAEREHALLNNPYDIIADDIAARLQNVSRIEQMLVETAKGLREGINAQRVRIRLGTLPTDQTEQKG